MSKPVELEDKSLIQKVAKKIKARRSELGISQEQLALRAGVHRTYIGVIERAEQNLTITALKKICDALGVSLAEFFGEFVQKKPVKPVVRKTVEMEITKGRL